MTSVSKQENVKEETHRNWSALAAFLLLAEYYGCVPGRDVGQLKGIVAASVLQTWDKDGEGAYIYEQKTEFSKALREALEDNNLSNEVALQMREFLDNGMFWEDVYQLILSTPNRLGRDPQTKVPAEQKSCDCCGTHIRQLKPFAAGDPLVGDFDGSRLVKTWRPLGPYDEEAEQAMREAQKCYQNDGYEDCLGWMVDKYGEVKGKTSYWTALCHSNTDSSWECRDCLVLDEEEYFKRRRHHQADEVPTLPDI